MSDTILYGKFLNSLADGTQIYGQEGGIAYTPDPGQRPEVDRTSLIIQDVNTIYDLERYRYPRIPLLVSSGHVDALREVPDGTDVSSLPLKFPGTDLRVPNEFDYLKEIICDAAAHYDAVNPTRGDEYYAYMSLERNRVLAGETQRTPGVHSDGIQGRGVHPKLPIEHMFTASDEIPTIFDVHPFELGGIDLETEDILDAMRMQADSRRQVQFSPGDLVHFDAYNVHHPIAPGRDTDRTFFRIVYSRERYNRPGNTVNSMFLEKYVELGWVYGTDPRRQFPADFRTEGGKPIA